MSDQPSSPIVRVTLPHETSFDVNSVDPSGGVVHSEHRARNITVTQSGISVSGNSSSSSSSSVTNVVSFGGQQNFGEHATNVFVAGHSLPQSSAHNTDGVQLNFQGDITGNVIIQCVSASAPIEVRVHGNVGGRLQVTSGGVRVDGDVHSYMSVTSGNIDVRGSVGGAVRATSGDITIYHATAADVIDATTKKRRGH